MTKKTKDTKELREKVHGVLMDIVLDDIVSGNAKKGDIDKAIYPCVYKLVDLIHQERQKAREVLERLKLEFDVVVCDCGEKWSETDAAIIVNEFLEEEK